MLVQLEVANAHQPHSIGGTIDEHRAPFLHDLTEFRRADVLDELLVILEGFLREADFEVQRAPHCDGLEVLRTHDSAHTCATGSILVSSHHTSEAHQVFPRHTDAKHLDLRIVQFFLDEFLSCGDICPPEMGAITNLDLPVMNPNVRRLICLSFDH